MKKKIEERTERELQETLARVAIDQYKTSESIRKNLQFFFYLTVISIAIGIFIIILNEG